MDLVVSASVEQSAFMLCHAKDIQVFFLFLQDGCTLILQVLP